MDGGIVVLGRGVAHCEWFHGGCGLNAGSLGVQAKRDEDRHKGDKKALPDIRHFIKPAGMMETRYVRLLSSLCAQTYVMHKMTVGQPSCTASNTCYLSL
jgi:hypothetical protein